MGKRENEFYETHTAVTGILTRHVPIFGMVSEPCAGKLAIVKALVQSNPWLRVTTNDIDTRFQTDYHLDAARSDSWHIMTGNTLAFDWVITNPPFSLAHLIIPLAYQYARIGIAMLLRLSYLEPCQDRAGWMKANQEHLAYQIIMNPRPSFTEDGKTDNVTACWLVWTKKRPRLGTQVIFETDWRK